MSWLPAARRVLETRSCLTIDGTTGAVLEGTRKDEVEQVLYAVSEDEVDLLRDLGNQVALGIANAVLLDLQTANVLVTVHDALNPASQAKFAALSVVKATTIAWKCVK